MTVIYDFNAYRARHLLRSFSRQTKGVAGQLSVLDGELISLHEHVKGIREAYDAFRTRLDDCVVELDKATDISQKCLTACELSSLEQMIKMRDQIVRECIASMPPTSKCCTGA